MLLTDEYKDGVPVLVANKFMAKPSIACETIEGDQRAISFHLPTQMYRFNTPAHRWAAERWVAGEATKKPKWYSTS
jgi:hypothetical protein